MLTKDLYHGGKNVILIFCLFSFLLFPIMIEASFTGQIGGGVYGRIFGNTGEWVSLDPRHSEFYDLNLSFGFFIQAFVNSVFGLEAGYL